MTLAEQIRDLVDRRYIAPARRVGQPTVTIKVGDVHKELGLKNRVPAVCSALQSKLFARQCGVVLLARDGPQQGTSVQITYSIGSDPVVGPKVGSATKASLIPVEPDRLGDSSSVGTVSSTQLSAYKTSLVEILDKLEGRRIRDEAPVPRIRRLGRTRRI